MTDAVVVEALEQVGAEETAALARLLPQLSSSAPPLDAASLATVAGHAANTVFVARSNGEIIGACLLVVFPTTAGVRALLEDVVVDSERRGGGIGSALVNAAIAGARAAGAKTLDLTSRPSREAANRLYARCGFERRETNVWRRELRS
ncbi:MAG: GNAT family N-acetyltransferase [Actinomycetota bacterium]|nr:GNAT family N-acetyltransferase [Actinomycetota bacterium]